MVSVCGVCGLLVDAGPAEAIIVVLSLHRREEANVAITTLTSREFNQDVARAKRAAAAGPVVVTDRGRPSLVLVTYEDWLQLSGKSMTIAEALTGTLAAAEIDFDPLPDRTLPSGPEFD